MPVFTVLTTCLVGRSCGLLHGCRCWISSNGDGFVLHLRYLLGLKVCGILRLG